MTTLFRLVVTFVAAVAAFYFTRLVAGALLFLLHLPPWLSIVFALAACVAAGRAVWIRPAGAQPGLVRAVVVGAFVTGGIGFAGGFFGPIIFAPEANQGPLLGIFITGPIGFLAGAIGGGVYWLRQRRRAPH